MKQLLPVKIINFIQFSFILPDIFALNTFNYHELTWKERKEKYFIKYIDWIVNVSIIKINYDSIKSYVGM